MEDNQSKNHLNIKDSVLRRIEKEGLHPLPLLYFQVQEYVLWSLWGFSVVFGALSVAVLYFIAIHANYSFYAIVNDNFLTFAFKYLPYVWLLIFAMLVAIAYINFSYTRHGYRYPVNKVVLSSLALSLLGGLALHVFGAGFYIDRELGRLSNTYDSQEELVMEMWQNAKEGRLVGVFDSRLPGAPTVVRFKDAKGALWFMETGELDRKDIGELLMREPVKVIGVVATSSNFMIHACGVFPWMLKKPPFFNELREVSQEFLKKTRPEIDDEQKFKPITQAEIVQGDIKMICAHFRATNFK